MQWTLFAEVNILIPSVVKGGEKKLEDMIHLIPK